MDETISREATMNAIDQYLIGRELNTDGETLARILNETVIKRLQPVTPRRGRWMQTAYQIERVCSCCGHVEPYKFAEDDVDIYNFCPHCGADMRGEQNEQMPLPDTCGAPEAEPSVGKWIEKEADTEDKEEGWETVIVCSRCDLPATTFYSKDGEERTQIRTRFCPNCGAKMERGTVAIVGRGSGKGTVQLEEIKKGARFEGMSRIKGRYEGRLIVSIDMPSDKCKNFPIAEIKDSFQKYFTRMLCDALKEPLKGEATVELEELHLDVYEVTE